MMLFDLILVSPLFFCLSYFSVTIFFVYYS
ncbi:hypothetical protein LINGRAHAP2_LOCUS37419 [Linum grandiflorum]